VPGAVHVGTSGWHYKHWKGPFYPADLPASRMLAWYAQHFDTVEINNSFYKLPTEAALESWRDATPAGFLFAVKGSRFLTHMKKLKDPEEGIARFMERVAALGPKLGPVLFQLPPFWDVNLPRLEAFLRALPRGPRYAFELRNPTWHTPKVSAALARHNAAFCIWELAGARSPVEITGDWTYIRLHGPGGPYQGSYDRHTMEDWAGRIRQWRRGLRAIYLYFDNDQGAFAAHNAAVVRQLLHSERVYAR
jgi:uncharacterized protein YecE (DUF72 family)